MVPIPDQPGVVRVSHTHEAIAAEGDGRPRSTKPWRRWAREPVDSDAKRCARDMDDATVAALTDRLEEEPAVLIAWVFGSVVRGDDAPGSDVDVAIFLAQPRRPRTLEDLPLTLQADLTRRLGREFDLVVVDWAPYDLVHRVLRDGRLLIDRDRSARIRFEADARNRYFDMQPIWKRYRRTGP